MIKKEQKETLFQSIKLGLNDTDSCQRARISRDWFYDEQKRSKEFAQDVADARLAFKTHNVAIIQKAAAKSWTASAWLLERKYPDEYAMRQRLEHTGKGGAPLNVSAAVNFKGMNEKELEKLGDKLDAILRPQSKSHLAP